MSTFSKGMPQTFIMRSKFFSRSMESKISDFRVITFLFSKGSLSPLLSYLLNKRK
jgi:hypothetical protein